MRTTLIVRTNVNPSGGKKTMGNRNQRKARFAGPRKGNRKAHGMTHMQQHHLEVENERRKADLEKLLLRTLVRGLAFGSIAGAGVASIAWAAFS